MLPVSFIIRMFGFHLILFAWLHINPACVGVCRRVKIGSGHCSHSCLGLTGDNCVECILWKGGGGQELHRHCQDDNKMELFI
jgi:hypothetical protein